MGLPLRTSEKSSSSPISGKISGSISAMRSACTQPKTVAHSPLTDEPDLVLDLTLLPARCRRARLLHEGEYRGIARRLAAGLRIATATIFAPATA